MQNDHILLTGGGTLGPVTPLLAVAAEWKKRSPDATISWVGTPKGPEKALIEAARYDFYPLRAPKFDRTRLWKLPFVVPFFLLSCVNAFFLLKRLKPSAVLSAGAYVSVPVVWMAWILRIPVWIHQLDVTVGLANKLMAPFARKITVTWSESAAYFSKKKTEVAGAMVRKMLKVGEPKLALDRYSLDPSFPTVLVMGGGTGAQSINEAMAVIGSELIKRANVIHLTGKGKSIVALSEIGSRYVSLEFLDEGMADAYALADVVVARAGMGTIAELSALGKPTVLIPLIGSQQGANAHALEERQAVEALYYLTPQTLLQAIDKLLLDPDRCNILSSNIRGLFPLNADERIVDDVAKVLGTS